MSPHDEACCTAADYDGFTVYLCDREPAGQCVAPASDASGCGQAAGEQSCPDPNAGAALALLGHGSGEACSAAEGGAAGRGASSADPRDPGSGAEPGAPGGDTAGGAERVLRRASSTTRYAAASDMFSGASEAARDDDATARLIRRHAVRLAELNCRGAGAVKGSAGGRECSVM